MKWEYKYIKLEQGQKKFLAVNAGVSEAQLNQLGNEEWELVSILQFNIGGTDAGAIFKRPKTK